MDNFLDEIELDTEVPSDSALNKVAELATVQIKLEGELDRAEKKVKDIKVKLIKVSNEQLPEAMAEAKLAEFKLESGQTVSIKEELTCSVPAKRRAEIIAKLREDRFDELILNIVEIDFDKGQDNLAGDVLGHAEELGLLAKRTEKVHTASLKKYLREKLNKGEEVDLSFFGAFLLRHSKIKQ